MVAVSAVRFEPGEGAVDVAPGGVVTHLVAHSPLVLLAPRNHGDAAWLYAGNLGGGLVDGDRLRLRVRVAAGAAAYLSTQSSTKVYAGASSQELEVDVAAGGLFVSAPDPVVCFAGADYRQRARVALAPDATLVWLDSLAAGRVARGERWAMARYRSELTVERDGRELLRDGLLLDPAHGAVGERLGRFDALATLVAVGPTSRVLRDLWLRPAALGRGAAVRVAPSPAGDDEAVVRLAAATLGDLRSALLRLLQPLTVLLRDDPFARKW
ncbi:MAG TPA: urease accessory protein UreD [Kofleriaceae bacterium]|nr:urease accessory protein UreD [Kofleriaceae bacterium]